MPFLPPVLRPASEALGPEFTVTNNIRLATKEEHLWLYSEACGSFRFAVFVREGAHDGYNVCIFGGLDTFLVSKANDSDEPDLWLRFTEIFDEDYMIYMLSRWSSRMLQDPVLENLGFHRVRKLGNGHFRVH
jgi:hypothetical protein